MASIAQKDDPSYTTLPVYRDSSLSESDSEFTQLRYISAKTQAHQRRKCFGSTIFWLTAFLVVGSYTSLVTYVTSAWWNRERTHGSNVVETPLRPFIRYQAEIFPQRHWSDQYPLVGQPSDELDARWREIMANFYAEVPYEYMEKLGRLDEGIQLENGNFVATYSVIHILHCVKRLHQSYFPARYFPNMTQEEDELQLEHNLHCLQMVVQAIMCQADIVPITAVWMDNQPLPSGNRHVEHECVDWNLMIEGMKQKRIDPFEKGVFVHPFFGAVVPDGRATLLKDRIGYGHMGKVLKKVGENGEWRVEAKGEDM